MCIFHNYKKQMKRQAQGCYNALKNILLISSLARNFKYELLLVCCLNGFVLLLAKYGWNFTVN